MRPEESQKTRLSIQEVYECHIGEFGLGQWRAALLINITWIILAFQVYLMSFAEEDPISNGHWKCTSETDVVCTSAKKLKNLKKISDAFCHLDSQQWEWTRRGASVISEFNIACDSYKVQFARSMYFAGNMTGAVGAGYLSDRVGRFIAMIASVGICGLALIAASASPSFLLYAIARSLSGIGTGGYTVVSFVLVSEILGASIRAKQAFVCMMFYAGGGCLMVVLAIFIHSWRILTFTISLITCLTFLIFPFIPNSPQWLLVNDKKDEAYKVLESIAKANRRELPDRDSIQVPGVQTVNQSILDILKHSKLRTWVLVNILTWATACLLYYGLALALDSMPGTLAVKFFLISSIEIPSSILYMLLVDVVGRKPLFVAGFLLGGAACLLIPVVPSHLSLAMAVVGKFGVAGSFDLAFLYTSEIFPTSARNLILGVSSLAARIGGIIAPQVVLAAVSLDPSIPFIIFGGCGLFAGLISLALPETRGQAMPDTVQNVDIIIQESKPKLSSYQYWKASEKEGPEQQSLLE